MYLYKLGCIFTYNLKRKKMKAILKRITELKEENKMFAETKMNNEVFEIYQKNEAEIKRLNFLVTHPDYI